MKRKKLIQLDFEIDKLTNSIENAVTGEVFDTVISRLSLKDGKSIRNPDWLFDWKIELKNKDAEVYKLTTQNNLSIIHGLISLTDKGDHIFMDLIES